MSIDELGNLYASTAMDDIIRFQIYKESTTPGEWIRSLRVLFFWIGMSVVCCGIL